jgi:hypothetical protein
MTWCSELRAIPGFVLASSAIRCRFVDRFVGLRVPSHVSRQRFSTPGASLPSAGTRLAGYPDVAGHMEPERIPPPATPCAFWFGFRGPRRPSSLRVSPRRSRAAGRGGPGRGPLFRRRPTSGCSARGRERDLTGFLAVHPVSLPWSQTPAESPAPCPDGAVDAAPASNAAKASALT